MVSEPFNPWSTNFWWKSNFCYWQLCFIQEVVVFSVTNVIGINGANLTTVTRSYQKTMITWSSSNFYVQVAFFGKNLIRFFWNFKNINLLFYTKSRYFIDLFHITQFSIFVLLRFQAPTVTSSSSNLLQLFWLTLFYLGLLNEIFICKFL